MKRIFVLLLIGGLLSCNPPSENISEEGTVIPDTSPKILSIEPGAWAFVQDCCGGIPQYLYNQAITFFRIKNFTAIDPNLDIDKLYYKIYFHTYEKIGETWVHTYQYVEDSDSFIIMQDQEEEQQTYNEDIVSFGFCGYRFIFGNARNYKIDVYLIDESGMSSIAKSIHCRHQWY